jgi:hypothetical protein
MAGDFVGVAAGAAVSDRECRRRLVRMWAYSDYAGGTKPSLADKVFRLLLASPRGLTRSEISGDLSRRTPSVRIRGALGVLYRQGRVWFRGEKTGGRPAERWFARA